MGPGRCFLLFDGAVMAGGRTNVTHHRVLTTKIIRSGLLFILLITIYCVSVLTDLRQSTEPPPSPHNNRFLLAISSRRQHISITPQYELIASID
jgi:hypothetical protein